jgi:hypothetical protein
MLKFQVQDRRAQVMKQRTNNQPVATLIHPVYHDSFADGLTVVDRREDSSDPVIPGNSLDPNETQVAVGFVAESSKLPALSLVAKRMVVSGRITVGLQETGLATIFQQYTTNEITHDPVLFGYEEDYNLLGMWRCKGFGVTSKTKAVLSEAQLEALEKRPRTLSHYFELLKAPVIEEIREIPDYDFKKYCYARRARDKCWPVANMNAISSRKNLAETVTFGPVIQSLAREGVIPVVCFPNPKDSQHTVKVTFGPLLDVADNPIQFGMRYRASVIYKILRMKNAVDHHDAWHPFFWCADAINLRLPPKSGLDVSLPIIEGQSPIGEILRIDEGLPRLGFPFHGSGGNAVTNGLAPPDAKAFKCTSQGAAVGATFETAQTVSNKMNRVMEQICESGMPLKVFLSGEMLPLALYDKNLQQEIGCGTEQTVYMGMYDVRWMAQEEPMTGRDLLDKVEFYKEYYPDLKQAQLRFLLATSKKFQLVPNDVYVGREGGYQHLEVDIRDDRKPIYEVPRGTTIDNIFRGLDDLSMISEKSILLDWVNGRGYLELVETPFVACKQPVAEEVADNTGLQEFEARLRPLDPDAKEERISKDLARRRRRTQTMDDHFDILRLCSLGAFARLCQLNVDTQMEIGPLIDLVKGSVVGSLATLAEYIQVFGSGRTRYLSRLGRAIQMSPTTHPVRTYDPKVLLLMLCNTGGGERQRRKGRQWFKNNMGAATDIFFQCIIIEVIRVEVLVEWNLCFHGSDATPRLPSLADIPLFLDFVAAVLRERGALSTKSLIQEQYLINTDFRDSKLFHGFFMHLTTELPSWFSRQVNRNINDCADLFGETTKLLVKFINNGIADSYTKQPFHCQHMLLNINEVVAEFPFGAPVTPVVGFGGNFGAQLLQDKEFKSNDAATVRTVMANLLDHYIQRSPSELLLLGLEKDDDGNGVKVIINGRPLGVCDPEHGCCIQYPVLERESGGSKGMSKHPLLVASFCHPIKGYEFEGGMKVAKMALAEFKRLVDEGKWKSKDGGDSGGERDSDIGGGRGERRR